MCCITIHIPFSRPGERSSLAYYRGPFQGRRAYIHCWRLPRYLSGLKMFGTPNLFVRQLSNGEAPHVSSLGRSFSRAAEELADDRIIILFCRADAAAQATGKTLSTPALPVQVGRPRSLSLQPLPREIIRLVLEALIFPLTPQPKQQIRPSSEESTP